MSLRIRPYEPADADASARLFFETVRGGTTEHYDEAQRRAWAPGVPDVDDWGARLANATTLVAEDERGLAGFLTLTDAGHLDLAYVRVDRLGTGVAKALYLELEQRAREAGLTRLDTDASLLARPFFERHGWTVVREQNDLHRGVRLRNFRMEKRLAGS